MTRLVPRMLLIAALAGLSCDERERDIEMESRHGTTRSHFPDTNCQSCHVLDDRITDGGDTPGFFTLAGTVRTTDGKPHGNVTIILYDKLFDTETKTAGKELMRVEADALGMFYTTRPLPEPSHDHHQGGESHHGGHLYPAVLDEEAKVMKHMYYEIDTGSCNMCHHDRYMDMSPRDDIAGDPWRQEIP